MKYMLMMNTPRGGDYQVMSWPKKDLEAHIAFMIGFAKKLGGAGELVGAEGLASPSQAKLVRAGDGGRPVTDGVFPETKEQRCWFHKMGNVLNALPKSSRARRRRSRANSSPWKIGTIIAA